MKPESAPPGGRAEQWLQEASNWQREGDLRKARRACRRATEIEPDNPDAHEMLGLLWLHSGQPGDAVEAFRRALELQPERPDSLYHLGVACLELGRLDRARSHFARAAELQPDHVDALVSLGDTARLLGRLDEAAEAFARALKQQPDHLGALSSLGFVELARGAYDTAREHFSRALERAPDDRRSLSGYGETLMAQRRYSDAAKWLREAIEKAPESPALHNDLGTVYSRLGDAHRAVEQFSQALRIDPLQPQTRLNLGLTLEQYGYLEDAEKAYLDTLRSEPEFTEAHYRLAHLHGRRSTPAEIDAMRRLLSREDMPGNARIQLAFALGHALESAGDNEAAFRCISEGHRLRAQSNHFSLEQAEKSFMETRNAFDRQRIEALRASGVPDERPVLVVGMPRSGLTLVEQILASHPLVHAGGESGLLGLTVAKLADATTRPWPEALGSLPAARLRQEAESYLARLEHQAGPAQRLVDNSALNFMHIGLATALLPDVRILHVRRDPRDNALSIYRELLGDMHSYAHDLGDLGRFYRLYEQLMAHWASLLGDRMHEVTYEALVKDAPSQIRRMLDFCGLPYHPGCLSFHRTERMVRSPAAAQVRQPLYDESIGAWRRYERQLQPLLEVLDMGNSE